jgi:predicted RNase H-like HicB family nuclease
MNPNGYSIILVWSEEDQAFIAMVPELSGCTAHGETRVETIREAEIAIENWLDTARELGREIPTPKHYDDYETQVDQATEEDLKKALGAVIAENAPAITEALAKEIAKGGEEVRAWWKDRTFWWITAHRKQAIERDPIPAEPKDHGKGRG